MSKAVRFILIMILVPCLLSALETVNLVKNHSFEEEDIAWESYTGFFQRIENDSAEAKVQDSSDAFTGSYSASVNTRRPPGDPTPPPIMLDSAVVIQGFFPPKTLEDLDSLYWVVKILPRNLDFGLAYFVFVSLLFNEGIEDSIWGVYNYYNPSFNPGGDNSYRKKISFELTDDTLWEEHKKSLDEDWVTDKGLPTSSILDSLGLGGYGAANPNWHGQKVYWDDIRLMGYADYDVGVKEILSGDSLEVGTPYQPEARIKNFGREPADTFLAMAEIWDGTNLIYVDTIPYSLPPDTSEIITFADFVPSATGPYTLTIRTHMEPDESDADDALSKQIGQASITEKPTIDNISLDVHSFTSPLRVSYFLPSDERGTISVYDATGRRIERKSITGSGSLEFSDHLSSGVYLVQLESNGQRVTRKAVVIE